MKKVIILLLAILTAAFLSSCYSESDVARARRAGYEEGYDLAKYEAKGEIERERLEAEESAYERGYDAGYDAGYWDGLDEAGLNPYHGSAKIEKDE